MRPYEQRHNNIALFILIAGVSFAIGFGIVGLDNAYWWIVIITLCLLWFNTSVLSHYLKKDLISWEDYIKKQRIEISRLENHLKRLSSIKTRRRKKK